MNKPASEGLLEVRHYIADTNLKCFSGMIMNSEGKALWSDKSGYPEQASGELFNPKRTILKVAPAALLLFLS
jgi:hypothetical protein